MSNRERVQQEAEEYATRKASGTVHVGGVANEGITVMRRIEARNAFIAGRTVTAEQIDQATLDHIPQVADELNGSLEEYDPRAVEIARDEVRAIFRTAGFIVPEEA